MTIYSSSSSAVSSRRALPMSEVIRRKSRMIGSDDLRLAAGLCRWAEQAGLRGPALKVAEGLATALESCVELSTHDRHFEAAKKAASVMYVLNRNDRVAGILVDCRDGRKRRLSAVVQWYSDRNFAIAADLAAAEQAEAIVASSKKTADEALAAKRAAVKAA